MSSFISKMYAGAGAPEAAAPVLLVTTLSGDRRFLRLDAEEVTLGRLSGNTLSFPRDDGLSRHHLTIRSSQGRWYVEDLGSKNGTCVNGADARGRYYLGAGDVIVAGEVTMTFLRAGRDDWSVHFEPAAGGDETAESTLLSQLLRPDPAEPAGVAAATRSGGRGALWAFMRAGRELAVRRPLPQLFATTLELSMEAIGAERGALLTLDEGDRLVVQASHGGQLRISASTRDRVLTEKISLLVRDVPSLTDNDTVVHTGVQTLIAAPLQTDGRVIGLVYLESSDPQHNFTKDDLDLLTVMANVASIQIERERWELQRDALVSENVERLRGLAAAVSHELNTPLGALKSTVDSLLKAAARGTSAAPKDQARMAKIQAQLRSSLDASLARMEQVMGHIQRFTNLDRGALQSVDLNELLSDVLALTRSESGAVTLTAQPLPDVHCDRQSLTASFASLVGLAVQTAAPAAVEVSTHAAEGAIEVRIRAPGENLAAEAAGKLFDPTFRVAEGRISAGNWSLFTAQQVIQELGGRITVDASVAGITTFTVRLPTA